MNRTKKILLSVLMLLLTTSANAFPFISPYAYCNNNPMNRIDPDGMDDYYTSDGLFLFRDDKETDRIIIRNTDAVFLSLFLSVIYVLNDRKVNTKIL